MKILFAPMRLFKVSQVLLLLLAAKCSCASERFSSLRRALLETLPTEVVETGGKYLVRARLEELRRAIPPNTHRKLEAADGMSANIAAQLHDEMATGMDHLLNLTAKAAEVGVYQSNGDAPNGEFLRILDAAATSINYHESELVKRLGHMKAAETDSKDIEKISKLEEDLEGLFDLLMKTLTNVRKVELVVLAGKSDGKEIGILSKTIEETYMQVLKVLDELKGADDELLGLPAADGNQARRRLDEDMMGSCREEEKTYIYTSPCENWEYEYCFHVHPDGSGECLDARTAGEGEYCQQWPRWPLCKKGLECNAYEVCVIPECGVDDSSVACPDGLVCASNYKCYVCVEDGDCADGEWCDHLHQCKKKECKADSECSESDYCNDSSHKCLTRECQSGDDCDADEVCKDQKYCQWVDDGDCFSGITSVQVLAKGEIKMMDLRVGDQVLTKQGVYEPVYAFAHLPYTKKEDFLQVYTKDGQGPLEVTKNHLIFVKGRVHPVPAVSLQVGDLLDGVDKETAITKIQTVTRDDGLYAPLTPSGTIMVNGVAASNYITIGLSNDSGAITTSKGVHIPLSEDQLQHISLAPIRLLCMGVSQELCNYRTEKGQAWFGALIEKLASVGDAYAFASWPLVILVLLVSLPCYALETVFGAPNCGPVLFAVGLLLFTAKGAKAVSGLFHCRVANEKSIN